MARNRSFDTTDFDKKFASFSSQIEGAVNPALEKAGHTLLALSREEVPFDTGTLSKSGNVRPGNLEVTVGYNTEYAARLHEHPEYRFKRGRKGKYLEDPLYLNRVMLVEVIQAEIAAMVK